MRTFLLTVLVSGGLTVGLTVESHAQLSIQQPVFQSTGGYFAVSVPDRGGILLGSISRAGEFRRSYGFPCFRGSSVRRFAEHSSLSTHVWIQDLREMDRLVLEMTENDSDTSVVYSDSSARRAGLAWSHFEPRRGVAVEQMAGRSSWLSQRRRIEQLHQRKGSVDLPAHSADSGVLTTGQSAPFRPVVRDRNKALDPARNYRLGLEAEESGKLTLAKLHYQTAAQYGSEQAARRLREMGFQSIASKPAHGSSQN